MRTLPDVIDKLLAEIPQGEGYENLRSGLMAYKSSALYASPEAQGYWWRAAAIALNYEIGEPAEPWQKKVQDIFSGKEDVHEVRDSERHAS